MEPLTAQEMFWEAYEQHKANKAIAFGSTPSQANAAAKQEEALKNLRTHNVIIDEYQKRATDRFALYAQTEIDMLDLLKARGFSSDWDLDLYDMHTSPYQDHKGFFGVLEVAGLGDGSFYRHHKEEDADPEHLDYSIRPPSAHAKLAQMPARLDAIARFRATYQTGHHIYAPRPDQDRGEHTKRWKKMARRIREAVIDPRHPDHGTITAELGPVALYWAFNIGDKP